ncbi:MAG TPA: gamma-glutamyltransferase [Pseudorhodoplanes sp.]|nr:gamma-glutamyltransferase [Pseudorhodoplanes sp.]
MSRDFHLPGRSPVIAREGMVATSHPLAAMAAIDTLRAGGNAADAAIAAVALLGVVEPGMTGIGGDCFCLVARPGERVWGYNGSGRAGAAMRAETLAAAGVRAIEQNSAHAVTVPGAVDAWDAILARHGRFGLDRALQPAIRASEEGFPVAPRVAHDWALFADKLRADPAAARHYLPGGAVPRTGDVVRFPALSETFKTIARGGRQAFYEGDVAADIVATLAARGGVLTMDDFAAHRGEEVTPISSNYRGLDVVEIPPNGQGLTALVLLNILERFDMARLDPLGAERFHIALEAARLAYAVRDTHVADPDFMRVSVPALLDRGFAARLADRIDRQKRVALPDMPAPDGDTVLLTVVDRDRMAVSIINSLFFAFGGGIATDRTGILLHNRGHSFVVDPADHPNAIGPRKRPLHTIIPALGMREGRCEYAFGVMGGSYQAMGHAQAVSNLIDYGMDVQEALDAPRAFFEGNKTVVERGVPARALEGLKARGHDLMVRDLPFGGGQIVRIDWERGVLIGGSDPRKDGCALGY